MNRHKFLAIGLLAAILISGWSWYVFSYPRIAVIDLSVSRPQAVALAENYLRVQEKVDPSQYFHSVMFSADSSGDRYLQKSMGFAKEEKFIETHNLDLFVWIVRFMNEGKKEEYRIAVSSKTGEIISVGHQLEDSAARKVTDEDTARKRAEDFLRERFKWNFDNYDFHSKSVEKFDHRMEYTFQWEKKNIYIRWSLKPDTGGARLLTSVSVSGDDILKFYKQIIIPPDEFNRAIESQREIARNLGLVANILSLGFLIGAIWVVVQRRNHLAMNVTKRFYVGMGIFLAALAIVAGINNSQSYIFNYPTTQPFMPYLIRQIIFEIVNQFFVFACFVVPCLAAELVHFEIFPKKPKGSFFHYVSTTFFSRDLAKSIFLGYVFAIIMIGLQAAIFEFGFRYLGVWVEQTRLNNLSSGYFPFLAALIIGVNASFMEETLYRFFGISFGTKIFKNLVIAVVVSSVVWGLGHTGYMVFPFWFRGLEVSLLGILISIAYLRFGLVCVIVQHFLFDAFWGSSPYIFGRSEMFNFVMSIAVLLLPLFLALIAYLKNSEVLSRNLSWRLNAAQKYNLEILKCFMLRQKLEPSFVPDQFRTELIKNGWDIAVIDVAFKQLDIPLSGENQTFQA